MTINPLKAFIVAAIASLFLVPAVAWAEEADALSANACVLGQEDEILATAKSLGMDGSRTPEPSEVALGGKGTSSAVGDEDASDVDCWNGSDDVDDMESAGNDANNPTGAMPDDIIASGDSPLTDKPASGASDVTVSAVVRNGWVAENGNLYFYRDGVKAKGWLVVDTAPNGAAGGLERYWLDPTTGALTKGLISASSAGWWAFGTSYGHVVRGVYRDAATNYWYFADNDGRLLAPGWHVTGAYTNGRLERYYIDANAHAAVPGVSFDGYKHFTRGDTGYVARGRVDTGDGTAFLADNNGRLYGEGFLVTSEYGQGLQRYYVDSQGKTATGLINAGGGHWAYGLKGAGYVLRGVYRDAATNYWYFADNDGRLLAPGWHVTGAYTNGRLERYYIDANAHAAVPGASSDGYFHYTRVDGGFVARGRLDLPDGRKMYADNDGRLLAPGWQVTTAFGQGLQRYYIEPDGGTKIGFFRVDGKAYYGRPGLGYVLRGKLAISGRGYTQIFLADNNGLLADYEGWLVTGLYDGGSPQRYRLDSGVAPGFYGAHLGLFAIGGKNYYGRFDQGYVVRGVYWAPDGQFYYADNDGVLGSVNVSGDAELDRILTSIIASHGRDLRTLFNYVASYRYVSGSTYPTGDWSIPFAKEMYYNGGGNCYRYAALFCWLAKAVGYDANVISGHVPSRSQGRAPHGWVEIHMNGMTYVCDPDMVASLPNYNWYMNTYGNAPITYYK